MKLSMKRSEIPQHLRKYFTAPKPKYKSGDLVNIPHLVSDALQDDGWVLRQDIIWHKPSPMPESVRNRCTKAHEYIFLLTKSNRYYYDAEAIKEKALQPVGEPKQTGNQKYLALGHTNGNLGTNQGAAYSNKRSVWTVATSGYPGAHFACFPPNLIRPCILAGTSEHGACNRCGAPWRRVVETKQLTRERPNRFTLPLGEPGTGGAMANDCGGVETRTTGWEPTCSCFLDAERRCKECVVSWKVEKTAAGRDWNAAKRREGREMESGNHSNGREDDEASLASSQSVATNREMPCTCFSQEVTPCVVMDPFIGSGTTCALSASLGRHSVGIDLSESYLLYNAIPRVEGELLSYSALRHLVEKPRQAVSVGRRV